MTNETQGQLMTSTENTNSPAIFETPKILVADDDETTRILLRTALTQWGYHVIEAGDGEEAWQILQQPDPPHILTLDWLMPKLDGISLCRRIDKELYFRPYIIFLTRMTGTENVIQGLEAGADEFILKPFDLTELRIRVFAGERIINYRHQLIEQNKKLQEYVSNIEDKAKEQAKQIIPFTELENALRESVNIMNQMLAQPDKNKEHNEHHIKKMQTLIGKINFFIERINLFLSDAKKIESAPHFKNIRSTPVAKPIPQKGKSLINMERMHAFFGNDQAAICDFIKTFISISTDQISEIENAILTRDAKSAKYFFHLLGGACGNSGIMKMSEVCGKGEERSAQSDWDTAAECANTLKNMVEKLHTELKAISKK